MVLKNVGKELFREFEEGIKANMDPMYFVIERLTDNIGKQSVRYE